MTSSMSHDTPGTGPNDQVKATFNHLLDSDVSEFEYWYSERCKTDKNIVVSDEALRIPRTRP